MLNLPANPCECKEVGITTLNCRADVSRTLNIFNARAFNILNF